MREWERRVAATYGLVPTESTEVSRQAGDLIIVLTSNKHQIDR